MNIAEAMQAVAAQLDKHPDVKLRGGSLGVITAGGVYVASSSGVCALGALLLDHTATYAGDYKDADNIVGSLHDSLRIQRQFDDAYSTLIMGKPNHHGVPLDQDACNLLAAAALVGRVIRE